MSAASSRGRPSGKIRWELFWSSRDTELMRWSASYVVRIEEEEEEEEGGLSTIFLLN